MAVTVRKGQGDVKLTREEFERRLRERFYDPEFQSVEHQIADIVNVAWKAYDQYHKSPRKRKAGPGFANPEVELPIEWLDTRRQIQQAEREQKDASRQGRVLLVCDHVEQRLRSRPVFCVPLPEEGGRRLFGFLMPKSCPDASTSRSHPTRLSRAPCLTEARRHKWSAQAIEPER